MAYSDYEDNKGTGKIALIFIIIMIIFWLFMYFSGEKIGTSCPYVDSGGEIVDDCY